MVLETRGLTLEVDGARLIDNLDLTLGARALTVVMGIPVGIVTALTGAPFFLWVLRRAKNQGYW